MLACLGHAHSLASHSRVPRCVFVLSAVALLPRACESSTMFGVLAVHSFSPRHICQPFSPRYAPPQLLDQPLPLPYEIPKMEKPFADYEWDPTFPGSFKPGTRRENRDLDDVLAEWEGKENPACMEMPQDQLWQVPLAPPEDILSWLQRIGLLEDDEAAGEEADFVGRGDSLLEDEFDLDEDAIAEGGLAVDAGISDSIDML